MIFIVAVTAGCSKTQPPSINNISISEFSQKANISIGENSYDCLIDYIDGAVTVTALSSNVSGLSFSYNGCELIFNYEDMTHTYESISADIVNPAVEIYNVISAINGGEVTAVPTENGIRAEGSTSCSKFSVGFDKDYLLSEIELKNANIYIKFKAPS